jgi:membrane-associated phospholipid phosphatase
MTKLLRQAFFLARALFGRTARAMALAPLRWRAKAWAGAVVFVAGACVAYVEKTRIQDWIRPNTTEEPVPFLTNVLGGGWPVAALGVIFLVVGAKTRKRALVDTAAALAAGAVPCLVITKVGQFILAEDRPSEGGAMHFFSAFGHGVSGHAAATALLFFPLAAILGRELDRPTRTALEIALATWVVLVAWTRMSLGMHYAWNVLLGLGVGLYVGHVVTKEWAIANHQRTSFRALLGDREAPR